MHPPQEDDDHQVKTNVITMEDIMGTNSDEQETKNAPDEDE